MAPPTGPGPRVWAHHGFYRHRLSGPQPAVLTGCAAGPDLSSLFSDIDDFAHAPVIGDIGVGFAQALSAGRTFTTAPRGTAP